mgnify:CR=1 FL=1|tara:strand:+ start:10913 stop:11146 length:234 start_codon:yes stop_codon:yes gene_type:complete
MPIEAIVGPILALVVSMKFTKYTDDERKKNLVMEIDALRAEMVVKTQQEHAELAKKMLITVSPMAKALRELKETLGV